jgi:hypothetical protein
MIRIMEEKKFYERLHKTVVQPILGEYANQRKLTELSKILGIEHRSRLTELKNGSRKLTFFWLNLFVKGGIMNAESILRGRNLNELSEIELDTVLRLDPDTEILKLLYKAKKNKIDIKKLLNAVVPE